MHHYLEVLLEAFLDTAKVLPFLFIVYYLIELLEYKFAIKIKNSKLLKGKASPVIGAGIGCIPQCGFSVVSTDLYSKGVISAGALVAVYIATSDEAIPLMISNHRMIPWMFLLIAVKVVLAIGVGYLTIALQKVLFKKDKYLNNEVNSGNLKEEHHHEDHEHDHHEEETEEVEIHGGCCKHHVETKTFDWLHPMLHCLKISAFILIINFVFSCITHIWVGEQNLMNFLNQSKFLQPILAVLIGLIPNCASSVVLTELFVVGGLKFGALVAGLSVNAGLGLVILIKQNKNIKQNVFIISMLVIPSIIIGYLLLFI